VVEFILTSKTALNQGGNPDQHARIAADAQGEVASAVDSDQEMLRREIQGTFETIDGHMRTGRAR
jgi:hypothetical protein